MHIAIQDSIVRKLKPKKLETECQYVSQLGRECDAQSPAEGSSRLLPLVGRVTLGFIPCFLRKGGCGPYNTVAIVNKHTSTGQHKSNTQDEAVRA